MCSCHPLFKNCMKSIDAFFFANQACLMKRKNDLRGAFPRHRESIEIFVLKLQSTEGGLESSGLNKLVCMDRMRA